MSNFPKQENEQKQETGKGLDDPPCSRCESYRQKSIENATLAGDLLWENWRLKSGIKAFVKAFRLTDWGWDGDCGTGSLVDELEECLNEND